MDVLIWVLFILLIISAVLMVAVVLMQDTKSSGMGASFGGNSDSFFGRNQSKTREGKLKNATKGIAVLIGVLCIALVIILQYVVAA